MSIRHSKGECRWRRRFDGAKVLMRKRCCERHTDCIQLLNSAVRSASIRFLMLTFMIRLRLIQVKYAPKLAVTIVEGALDTGRIPEGNSIKLLCTSNANPSDVTFQWYMNDDLIADATLNELVISVTSAGAAINYSPPATKNTQKKNNVMVLVVQEIFNVTRRHQNSVVKCQAQNMVGVGVGTETLDIICTYICMRYTRET